jgi:hypothetical protein
MMLTIGAMAIAAATINHMPFLALGALINAGAVMA